MRRNIKIQKVLKPGEEDHEVELFGAGRTKFINYRYLSIDGQRFQTSGRSVKECKEKRDVWLKGLSEKPAVKVSRWSEDHRKVFDYVLDTMNGLLLKVPFEDQMKILAEYNRDRARS